MTWVKTGDEFSDAAAELSDAAVRTHMDALHWNARMLLDLHIPKKHLPRFAFSDTAAAAIDELIEAGWWEDEDTSWYLAYRPEWQWSKEQVTRRRDQNAQSQERGRRHRKGDHSLCLAGKCESAADSDADSAHDSDAESDADPVGVGWGGENTTTHLQERTATDLAKETGCYECQRLSAWPNNMPCPLHLEVG